LNTPKTPKEIRKEFGFRHTLALVDANRIAREVLGVPIVNTTMLGALLKATHIVAVDSMEQPLQERFGPLAVKNFNALKVAYEQTIIEERRS
jgi:Pyruvate/2-oxoacid:ferredoxin oxidoreductase gamma subunit